jgi:aminoglycoside 3-N-acetyltransferase
VTLQSYLTARGIISLLPETQQQSLKFTARKLRAHAFHAAFSYGVPELEAKLRKLGIREGDAILMQSAFSDLNGFAGEALDVLDCVMRILGPDGHLFMVSMPYTGSARSYLQEGKPFDVRRTPSQMGLLSELFRRRKGVVRSANPMHPVLAWGPKAAWLIDGHETLSYSCGEDSPFERMLSLETKALLFDVDLDVLTFTHYLEHAFQDSAPTPVYASTSIEALIVDGTGKQRNVALFPFAPEAMKLRNFGVLYDELIRRGLVQENRVGNTDLRSVHLRDVFECGQDMVSRGQHIFAHQGEPTHIKPIRAGRSHSILARLRQITQR